MGDTLFIFTMPGLICVVGTEKSVRIQSRGVIILKGVKTSKNCPVGVQYDRLIILEGCSLTEVSLYVLNIGAKTF